MRFKKVILVAVTIFIMSCNHMSNNEFIVTKKTMHTKTESLYTLRYKKSDGAHYSVDLREKSTFADVGDTLIFIRKK